MIKVVTMPVAMKYPSHMIHFREELEQRRKSQDAVIGDAERELAKYLGEGYQMLTSHVVESTNDTSIIFVLHKITGDAE